MSGTILALLPSLNEIGPTKILFIWEWRNITNNI